jgi:hypothetical protein
MASPLCPAPGIPVRCTQAPASACPLRWAGSRAAASADVAGAAVDDDGAIRAEGAAAVSAGTGVSGRGRHL